MAKKNKFLEEDQVSAIDLVAAECERIVNEEGFSADHDDWYNQNQSLAGGAAAYILPAGFRMPVLLAPSFWPYDAETWKPNKEHPSSEDYLEGRIRELVKGTAMAIKEIERLQRLKAGTNYIPDIAANESSEDDT